MSRTMVLDVAGLSTGLLTEMPALKALAGRGAVLPLEPVLPALTLPMQATFTTGRPPARHGIVANGLYFADAAEVRFWEQSARLLGAPRAWARASEPRVQQAAPLVTRAARKKERRADLKSQIGNLRFKIAHLFWQLGMYDPTIDVLLTPKPVHAPGDRLLVDCYSKPADLYRRLAADLGPFDLRTYWGPMAGIGSSRWIAQAALAVWTNERPDLCLVYLPQLDYSGHRAGPASDAHRADARELDAVLKPLVDAAEADGARLVVLSEYSFLPAARPVALNRALREAGFLAVREIEGGEYLYTGDSRAFAMVDNQVAHVYFPAAEDLDGDIRAVRALLEKVPGVARVLDRAAQGAAGLDHVRSGDLVVLAEPDAHFVYYWWLDDARAPAFARTVDIHSKPGFDAAELFFDPAARGIPLSAGAVRGSHGLVLEDGRGWGVYLDSDPPRDLAGRQAVRAAQVARLAMV